MSCLATAKNKCKERDDLIKNLDIIKPCKNEFDTSFTQKK